MNVIKNILIGLLAFVFLIFLLFYFNVMWRSPANFKVDEYGELTVPIMDMSEYEDIIETHRRPYIYSIRSRNGGSAHILGVEHSSDSNHPQFDSIKFLWNKVKPDVALVEGRLGFLFTWTQDPIKRYGERGITSYLAKRDGAKLYSWEPRREDEIELLMKDFSVDKIAMFYSLRPYFSIVRNRKVNNPEVVLDKFIKSRTNYKNIKGVFNSWEELDKMWKKDFPLIDWRNYSNEKGYFPEGYLFEIWNGANMTRDN